MKAARRFKHLAFVFFIKWSVIYTLPGFLMTFSISPPKLLSLTTNCWYSFCVIFLYWSSAWHFRPSSEKGVLNRQARVMRVFPILTPVITVSSNHHRDLQKMLFKVSVGFQIGRIQHSVGFTKKMPLCVSYVWTVVLSQIREGRFRKMDYFGPYTTWIC